MNQIPDVVLGIHCLLPICPGVIGLSFCWIVQPGPLPFPAVLIPGLHLALVSPLFLLSQPGSGPHLDCPSPLLLLGQPGILLLAQVYFQ